MPGLYETFKAELAPFGPNRSAAGVPTGSSVLVISPEDAWVVLPLACARCMGTPYLP